MIDCSQWILCFFNIGPEHPKHEIKKFNDIINLDDK